MARGDYVDVTYRTGAGTDKHRVQALTVGGSTSIKGHDGRDVFVTVEALDKNDMPIVRALFARAEVVSIIEGHEMLKSKKK